MSASAEQTTQAARKEPPEHFEERRGILLLWFGVLAGPTAWFLHLNVSYSLVRYICLGGGPWLLHLTSLLTVLLAGLGLGVARRSWAGIGHPEITTGPGSLGRTRFMAVGGLMLSGFFLVVILVAWIPDFLLHPCLEL